MMSGDVPSVGMDAPDFTLPSTSGDFLSWAVAAHRPDGTLRWAGRLDDPALPIDNNHDEQQIRTWALGRSNWLFAGSLRAGQRAAAITSLIQSAKRPALHGQRKVRILRICSQIGKFFCLIVIRDAPLFSPVSANAVFKGAVVKGPLRVEDLVQCGVLPLRRQKSVLVSQDGR